MIPIVIGGGPCAYNPEPLADFFDLFYIGEGETVILSLLTVIRKTKKTAEARKDFGEGGGNSRHLCPVLL